MDYTSFQELVPDQTNTPGTKRVKVGRLLNWSRHPRPPLPRQISERSYQGNPIVKQDLNCIIMMDHGFMKTPIHAIYGSGPEIYSHLFREAAKELFFQWPGN